MCDSDCGQGVVFQTKTLVDLELETDSSSILK